MSISPISNLNYSVSSSMPLQDVLPEVSGNENSIQQLENVVREVHEGKRPFGFVKYFTKEEGDFLDSLSTETFTTVFKILGMETTLFPESKSVNSSEDPSAKQAAKILNRMFTDISKHKFDPINQGGALYTSDKHPSWHTDGGFWTGENEQMLYLTFAIKGSGTQFFFPKEKERADLVKIRDLRNLKETVEKIVDKDPARAIQGNAHDLCIYHTGVIHRGPNEDTPGRILLSIASELMTPKIKLQADLLSET